MNYNIPNDWSLETGKFRTYCVVWPDSIEWEALFFGMLSSWRRGRTWNANSGYIKDAQLVGNEIWERNFNPPECSPAEDSTETQIFEALEASMAFITDIKCEDGWLWVYKCCEWHQVCEIGAITGNTDPSDLQEPDPLPTDDKCFKASAYGQHFSGWMNDIADYIYGNLYTPTPTLTDEIKALFPQNGFFTNRLQTLIEISKQFPNQILSMVQSTMFTRDIKCSVKAALDAYAIEGEQWYLTSGEVQTIKDNSHLYLPETYQTVQKSWVFQFNNSLQTSYIQNILGLYDPSTLPDCSDCGGGLSPQSEPTISGWYLTEGYSGNGYVENTDGGINEGVCAFGPQPAPVNLSGVAFRIVQTNANRQQLSTVANECGSVQVPNGPAQDFNFEDYYIICDADVWTELSTVTTIPYVNDPAAGWNNDLPLSQNVMSGVDIGVNVINIVIREAPGIEITDVRFVANVNNP